jgi:hypothetical protein
MCLWPIKFFGGNVIFAANSEVWLYHWNIFSAIIILAMTFILDSLDKFSPTIYCVFVCDERVCVWCVCVYVCLCVCVCVCLNSNRFWHFNCFVTFKGRPSSDKPFKVIFLCCNTVQLKQCFSRCEACRKIIWSKCVLWHT